MMQLGSFNYSMNGGFLYECEISPAKGAEHTKGGGGGGRRGKIENKQ